MVPPSPSDKSRILDILCAAFDANRSVDSIAGPGKGRERRIRALMDYSFEICRRFGRIYLSEDRSACALVLYPDRKRRSLAGVMLDLKLVFQCIGLRRLPETLRREALIKRQYPAGAFTYLWFIAVAPDNQQTGRGSRLLEDVLKESQTLRRPVYLETSVDANLAWYARRRFEIYAELDTGFPLYCLRTLATE